MRRVMKTILILVPRMGVGGISKIGSFVANTYSNNYNVILVSLIPDERSSYLAEGVKTATLSYNFEKNSKNPLNRGLNKLMAVLRLRRMIKAFDVDAICSFGLDLGKLALIASVGCDCRCLTSERGNPYRYSKKTKAKYDKVVSKSDAVVFQTQMARDAFCNCRIAGKSFIIQNPAIGRNSVDYKIEEKQRKKHIVYCGRLSKEKNIDMLINAYRKVGNKEYKLNIYGDGPEYQHLYDEINKYDLGERVEIIRDSDDVFALEANSEIFVLTSNEEGMPNALIEAMMCGMTCIATDCPPGGCRELLINGERGILVPVNDVDCLAEKLNYVICNPTMARELGEAALSIVVTNSSESIREKWNDALRSIVS